MSKSIIIHCEYNGTPIDFYEDGWFNATKAAESYGKRVSNWTRLKETQEYIEALMEDLNLSDVRGLIKTKSGKYSGGTWFHPDLAVPFARWLNVKFAIWCDRQIKALINGTHPSQQTEHKQLDWQQTRNQGKLNRRSATDAYQHFIEYAEAQGSKNAQHYYVLFTNMVYAELGVPKERNIRDNLGARELIRIAAAEDLIVDVIYEAIELDVEYHEIYRLAKIRVKNLVELLKKRITTDEIKRIAKIH